MSDWTVEELAEEYKRDGISRRRFVRTMAAAGLSMPIVASVLQACGSSKSGTEGRQSAELATVTPRQPDTFTPTKRGGGGTLKLLWWQAPVAANIHLSTGTKEDNASTIFTEPLAQFDEEGNLFPVLAAEAPSVQNGMVDPGGKSVTWKLKPGVQWHDGKPFTAEDVVFTFEYVTDKATAATTVGNYTIVDRVEKIDEMTVRVVFKEPTPYWQTAFVGGAGHIFPKHLVGPYKGAESRNSPYNLKPVGTGPFKVVDFRPGDIIIAEMNPNYHVPNRPFFDRLELKGGGDAPSAARAVLQTGEVDYAWNLQVEIDVLQNLEKNGIGRLEVTQGASTEQLQFNFTDPNVEVDGQKSSIKTKHPFFSDLKVRQAVSLAINRKLIVDELYGKTGAVGTYVVYNPKKFAPDPYTPEYNLQKANQLLDEAGWRRGPDGVRTKDGKPMAVVYQTSVNSVRQKTQAIIKKDLESIGFKVELKATDQAVFFGDSTNHDSYPAFVADLQMYTTGPAIDPQAFMRRYVTTEVAQKDNKWSGPNVQRYINPEMDRLWQAARVELDPIKRADYFKQMNQIVVDDVVTIPIVARRGGPEGVKNSLVVDLSSWANVLWKLGYWYRKQA